MQSNTDHTFIQSCFAPCKSARPKVTTLYVNRKSLFLVARLLNRWQRASSARCLQRKTKGLTTPRSSKPASPDSVDSMLTSASSWSADWSEPGLCTAPALLQDCLPRLIWSDWRDEDWGEWAYREKETERSTLFSENSTGLAQGGNSSRTQIQGGNSFHTLCCQWKWLLTCRENTIYWGGNFLVEKRYSWQCVPCFVIADSTHEYVWYFILLRTKYYRMSRAAWLKNGFARKNKEKYKEKYFSFSVFVANPLVTLPTTQR